MESQRGRRTTWSRALGRLRGDKNRRPLGDRAEDRALAWLERQGLELITRNYHCRYGEIDLLMRDGDTLVVVEVRCRKGVSLTSAALTVDVRKQARLFRTALAFIATHPEFDNAPVRFDVLGIDGDPARCFRPEWLRDAFRPEAC